MADGDQGLNHWSLHIREHPDTWASHAHLNAEMDVVCLSNLGLYTDYVNPATGTEGNTMVFACTYGAVQSCNSIRFFELNPRFDEVCPGQGAWMFNATNDASYGRDPARTVECWV